MLSSHRPKSLYLKLFEHYRSIGVSVIEFLSDYEVASRNAIRDIYPFALVKGCYFHFCNSLLKKLKKLKILTDYTKSKIVNQILHMYFSLAFVPIDELDSYIEIILQEINLVDDDFVKEKLLLFNEYFHSVWIEGSTYSPNRLEPVE